jgi:hypothetical protein
MSTGVCVLHAPVTEPVSAPNIVFIVALFNEFSFEWPIRTGPAMNSGHNGNRIPLKINMVLILK